MWNKWLMTNYFDTTPNNCVQLDTTTATLTTDQKVEGSTPSGCATSQTTCACSRISQFAK